MVSLNLGLSVLTLLSFTIVYVVFTKFFWGPIVSTVRKREETVRNELEEAKKARNETDRLRTEEENALLEAHREADRLIAEARRTAENIRADIIETAKMETQMILEQARIQAGYERSRILETLRHDISQLAMEATSQVLRLAVTPEEHREFVTKTIDNLVSK